MVPVFQRCQDLKFSGLQPTSDTQFITKNSTASYLCHTLISFHP
uniref:Uncharacterized protein n=1 Tax=Arundo donax TaxID=35708 RepID=A0A0A8Z0X6_ARUDO